MPACGPRRGGAGRARADSRFDATGEDALIRRVDVCGAVGQDTNVSHEECDPFVTLYRVEYAGMVGLAHALTGSALKMPRTWSRRHEPLQGRMAALENPGGYLEDHRRAPVPRP